MSVPAAEARRSQPAFTRSVNAAILAAAIAVPLLGRMMAFDAAGQVWFTGLDRYPLPTLCPSRWFGFRCLTCGATRSIIALMQGDIAGSLAMHRFGWLVLLLIVTQIPYRFARVLRPERRILIVERLGFMSLVITGVLVVTGRVLEALDR